MTTIRQAADRAGVDAWALVLSSQGIRSRITREPGGWALSVVPEDSARAARVLDLYESENPPRTEVARPKLPEWGPTRGGLFVAATLVAFYAVTGPRRPVSWFAEGSASAERILEGEWWRTVTALTLHADPAHVASNAAAGALFATAIFRWIGPGAGGALILVAGAVGNAINAFAHGAGHSSVGASTAVFGAVGLLGGLGLVRGLRLGLRWRRAWLPLAACLGILAMLGTAERTDIWAHGFGFVSGVGLGLLAAPLVRRPPGPIPQAGLAVATIGAIVWCWLLALG